MDSNVEHDENIETLLHHVDLSCCSDEMVTLSEDSREVGIYIAGYVAKKLKERLGDCWNGLLTDIVELKTLFFPMFKLYQEEVLEF